MDVYLKRICYTVCKLYLHNPDLKQVDKAKNLLDKSKEKPLKIKQKHVTFLGKFTEYFAFLKVWNSYTGVSFK